MGSPEYIGMRQPLLVAIITAATIIQPALLIAWSSLTRAARPGIAFVNLPWFTSPTEDP
jgi:hypothetical protein